VTFVRQVALPAAAASVPTVALIAALRLSAPPTSFIAVIAEGAFVALIYGAIFFGLGLRPTDRARYVTFLKRIAPRGRARAEAL